MKISESYIEGVRTEVHEVDPSMLPIKELMSSILKASNININENVRVVLTVNACTLDIETTEVHSITIKTSTL